MTRKWLHRCIVAACICTCALSSAMGAADEPKRDTSIEAYRSPLDALTERMVGQASRPVRFDWRRMGLAGTVQVGQVVELNNYHSTRVGGGLRWAMGGLMGHATISHVFTQESDSTHKLALTPYRQYGRPGRWELQAGVLVPLVEGVGTALPRAIDPLQFVLSAAADVTYMAYPGANAGLSFGKSLRNWISPTLSGHELATLAKNRPEAMQIDKARYAVHVGLVLDVFFHSGFFVSPKATVAMPWLTRGLTETQLGYYWDLTMSAGYAI